MQWLYDYFVALNCDIGRSIDMNNMGQFFFDHSFVLVLIMWLSVCFCQYCYIIFIRSPKDETIIFINIYTWLDMIKNPQLWIFQISPCAIIVSWNVAKCGGSFIISNISRLVQIKVFCIRDTSNCTLFFMKCILFCQHDIWILCNQPHDEIHRRVFLVVKKSGNGLCIFSS